MTEQHPITPPPVNLLHQWWHEALDKKKSVVHYVARKASQWGADQELDACCKSLRQQLGFNETLPTRLRTARRPKPLSLKQQALEELENMVKASKDFGFGGTDPTAIRQVLEALPE